MHDSITTVNEALRGATDWLARQRWFGEKTRPISAIEPDWQWLFHQDGIEFALSSVVVRYADGGDSRYFVPLAIVAQDRSIPDQAVVATLEDESRVVDALHVPSVQRWWVEQMAEGRSATGSHESWHWSHVGSYGETLHAASASPARVLTGEQSNTSLLFGQALILKFFRRLEPGLNPDVEIGTYLTTHFPTVPVPRTYGGTSMTHGGQASTVAAAQQFVANDGDCWRWLLRVVTEGTSEDVDEAARTIELLGTRTGELHMALGAESDGPAFHPQMIDAAFCARWRGALQHELDLTIHLLRQVGFLPGDADLGEHLGHILDHVDVLVGTDAIRVHGDYHLGQVLHTLDGDVSILDFEGEPSRPIADRRQRYPALKDVAGMTRSLDYARATVRRIPTTSLGDDERIDSWFSTARASFLSAYRAATVAAHGRLVPPSAADFARALALFELEKALYEARYELNNRPDWVSIPFEAIRVIATQGA